MREFYTSKKVVITLILNFEVPAGSHLKFIVLTKIVSNAEIDEFCVDRKFYNCLLIMFILVFFIIIIESCSFKDKHFKNTS